MARLALIAVAAAVAAAGCGGDGGGVTSPPSPGPDDPATRLEVTVWPQGRPDPSSTAEVECADPEGTTRECETANAVDASALAPTPPDAICTQIYGGPQEAAIEGTLRGEPIDVALSRQNGCEIDRYEAAEPLLELARG